MTVEQWLEAACADAETRHLPELKPLLAALSVATRALREADWNDDAGGDPGPDHLRQGYGGPPKPPTKAEGPGPRSRAGNRP